MRKAQNTAADRRIADAINLRNIHNVYAFSLVVCVLEAATLLLYTVINRNSPDFLRTLFSVGFCIVTCGIVAVLSQRIKNKHKRADVISSLQANALVIFFYVLMSAWGILVDATHYGNGNQMLTFFIVQFCFVCFVAMSPKLGSILIVLSFTALFLSVYFVDGAAHAQPLNFLIFAIIAVYGNAMQNLLLKKSEKSKLEISELNLFLQREASIDDLTQLRNRKALREDYHKHLGKTVTVLMADIDCFKSFNDTYGHVIGDAVLRMVASTAMEAFQGGEVYRYGGDEFLVIFPDCAEEAFEEMEQRWKNAVQAIHIPNIPHSVSCSSGSERCLLRSEEDLRVAINTADGRLYQAKQSR